MWSTTRLSERRPWLLVAGALALSAPARAEGTSPAPPDDSLAAYRERFRAGMDRYKGGAFADAIQYWEPIYREIGPGKGYRLAFDLARAYESVGESTRAAERYESFLAELEWRRSEGEKVDASVEREEKEARSRLENLKASKGRIKVNPGGRPVVAQIDMGEGRLGTFVAYVAPGNHVVTFSLGAAGAEKHDVVAKTGALVEIAPNPETQPVVPVTTPEPSHPPPPKPEPRYETVHPFPIGVVYIAAGATVASVLVPIFTYAHAWSLATDYRNSPRSASLTHYEAARSTAYATLAIPIGLGAITGGLLLWYLQGTKQREVGVTTAGIAPVPGGLTGAFGGTF